MDDNVGNGEKEAPKSDWVTKRSACSLPKIFKDLRVQIEEDVKTRNGLRPNNSPYEFSVTENGADFAVRLIAKDVRKAITFSLADHAISVRDDASNQMFEVTLSFNDGGDCKLYVNEQERDIWQVRRMALEDLFFLGY